MVARLQNGTTTTIGGNQQRRREGQEKIFGNNQFSPSYSNNTCFTPSSSNFTPSSSTYTNTSSSFTDTAGPLVTVDCKPGQAN